MLESIEHGVNVLIWFAINLAKDADTGMPKVTGGPDILCVKRVQSLIRSKGYSVTHMISIGGWNNPHPDTSNSPEQVWQQWKAWNRQLGDDLY